MKVAFDAVCFTQTQAGTTRVARGVLAAARALGGAEIAEVGGGSHRGRGSPGQKALALRQDTLWYGAGGVLRAAREVGADVLHCPTFRGPLRGSGPPIVLTVHDLAVLRHPAWFPRWSRSYGRFAVPRAIARAARIVCVSQATADDVAWLVGAEDRVRVVPNGIDELFSHPPAPPPVEGPYLLAVGTPEPRKNFDRLLAAYRRLRAAGRPEQLVIAGSGGWGGVEIAATDGVLALGRVPDEMLRDLYAGAAATVFPTLWEGFGLIAGEALAAGCRLVCSDLPVLREVAGDDAFYCDPTAVDDIAAAVERALAAPPPAPRRDLTWESAAATLLDVWQELA